MIDNGDYDEPEKTPQKRERVRRNYSEREYSKQLDEALYLEEKQDADSFSNEEDDDEMYDEGHIRLNWGGPLSDQWKKEDADVVVRALCTFGYSHSSWEDFMNKLELKKTYTVAEVSDTLFYIGTPLTVLSFDEWRGQLSWFVC